MESPDEDTAHSDLSLSFSEDLVPLRPPKPAGQTFISFSGLLDPPLLLHEDLKEGCGGQLWPAGMVLAEHLLRDLDGLRGKVILELGAGGGLVGLALALALTRSTAPGSTPLNPPVLITDLPQLLPLQKQNIELNRLAPSVLSAPLPWGSPLPSTVLEPYRHPDIVLAADCVYFEPAFPLLLETLGELLEGREQEMEGGGRGVKEGKEGKEEPVCWFCMKKRRKADMRFVGALRKKFSVEEIGTGRGSRGEFGGVFLYKVRGK